MKRYVEGENRSQSTLFPESLDDYIAEDNPVRVVDVFVEELDLKEMGFEGGAGGDGPAGVPSRHAAEDLYLRIFESHPVEPPPGARDAA
jgi:transposase